MRILLVSTYFPPYNAAASLRAHSFAKGWARAGEEVTVLTTPKRPDQQGFAVAAEGYAVREVGFALPPPFEWLRAALKRAPRTAPAEAAAADRRPAGDGPPRGWAARLERFKAARGIFHTVRMPDLSDFWVRPARAWASAQARDAAPWDVVVSSSGPYTNHLVARSLRRRGHARRWAADFRDLWTEHHAFPGLFPFTVLERRLERACLGAADLLTSVSPPLAARLGELSGKRCEVIFNGHDRELLAELPLARAFPDDGCVRLVYTGALYDDGQDPRPVIAALASLAGREPDTARRLRLVVAGRGRAAWASLAAAAGVSGQLELLGELGRSEAFRLQRDADALLILDWKRAAEGVLTSKLFEYLCAAAPILAVGPEPDSPVAEILRETRRGRHLGGEAAAIAPLLGLLARSPERLREVPDAAAVERYGRAAQAARYLELLRASALQSSPTPTPGGQR